MTITERRVGDVVILDLNGKMTLEGGDTLLKEAVDDLLRRGFRKIVLNLRDVPYFDAFGFGEIVRSYANTERLGGRLSLLGPLSKRVRDWLEITKLAVIFQIYDRDEDAVRSFMEEAKT